jgi:hypothetical protein
MKMNPPRPIFGNGVMLPYKVTFGKLAVQLRPARNASLRDESGLWSIWFQARSNEPRGIGGRAMIDVFARRVTIHGYVLARSLLVSWLDLQSGGPGSFPGRLTRFPQTSATARSPATPSVRIEEARWDPW